MIKRLSSKIAYQTPWMKVREDEILTDDGQKGTYSVVEKNDFALIIPVEDKHFYLVKQFRYSIQKWSLEFVQGMHEHDAEISPEDLAREELREETGLAAGSMKKIGFIYPAPGFLDQAFTAFCAEELTHGEAEHEEMEKAVGLEVVRLPIEELEAKIQSGEIFDGPTITAYGLMKAQKLL